MEFTELTLDELIGGKDKAVEETADQTAVDGNAENTETTSNQEAQPAADLLDKNGEVEVDLLSLLPKSKSKEEVAAQTESQSDDLSSVYKTLYDNNVKAGFWKEVDGAEDIDWTNADNYNKIKEAQEGKSTKQESKVISNDEYISEREGLINTLKSMDLSKKEEALKVLRYNYVSVKNYEEDHYAEIIKKYSDEDIISKAEEISNNIIKSSQSEIDEKIKIKDKEEKEAKAVEAKRVAEYETAFKDVAKSKGVPESDVTESLKILKNQEKLQSLLLSHLSDHAKAIDLMSYLRNSDAMKKNIEKEAKNKLVISELTKKTH